MFSLSLLPTIHHCLFQQTSVRPSTPCYRSFSLIIGRSLGFGSTPPYSTPSSDSVSLRLRCFNTLTLHDRSNSQAHSTKGTPSPAQRPAPTTCRSTVSGSISLPSRGAFHHFPHGTRSLSVAVSYLALDGGPPGFRQGFSCPAVLRYAIGVIDLSLTGLSPSLAGLPSAVLLNLDIPHLAPYNTAKAVTSCGLGSSPFARRY